MHCKTRELICKYKLSGIEATVNSKKCTHAPDWQMSLILSFVCNCHVLNQLPNHYLYKKHLIGAHHNQGLWNSSYFVNTGIAPKCKLMTYTNHLRRANELKILRMDGMKISFLQKIIWHSTLVYNQYHTVWYTNTL